MLFSRFVALSCRFFSHSISFKGLGVFGLFQSLILCSLLLMSGSYSLNVNAQTFDERCEQNGGNRNCFTPSNIPVAAIYYGGGAAYFGTQTKPSKEAWIETFKADCGSAYEGGATCTFMGFQQIDENRWNVPFSYTHTYGCGVPPSYLCSGSGTRTYLVVRDYGCPSGYSQIGGNMCQPTPACPAGYTNEQSWNNGGFCMSPATVSVDRTKKTCDDDRDCTANPILPSIGDKYEIAVDYQGKGPFPLVFKRTYHSSPVFGSRWWHSYQRRIKGIIDGSTSTATALRPDGKALSFWYSAGQWQTDADVNYKLSGDLNSSWRLTNKDTDEVEDYHADGRLLSITNRAGIKQVMGYDGAGRISSVTDPLGRQIRLGYDAVNRVVTMTDPANGVFTYGYDPKGNLSSITYPDNKTRTYLYENPAFGNALTGIIDENNSRYSTYTYNANGLVIQSEHPNGAGKVTVSYAAEPAVSTTEFVDPATGIRYVITSRVPPSGATVTDSLGNTSEFYYQAVLGTTKRAGAAAACAWCGDRQNTSFDANGNPANTTDFNGNQTTYVYDLVRNLETSRTEAAGTSLARTITTQWHSQYRLPVQIDEPGRRTVFNYDAVGNLLQKTITDTATNQSRTWTYTYNDKGQVLTEDGPRTDVSDITTYTYNTQGNLNAVTNALGHLTQITSYDNHGRPLTIIDPNGLVVTLKYDPRGRLTSKRVGTSTTVGELTTYEYDNVGQLTKVIAPNGAYLAYTYDAAHRLTQIQDQIGNKIVYTLDGMGNRTKEDIYNASGVLTQTRTRVYNNLNRLEQAIGGTNPSQQISQFNYDNNGNLTGITDPLNHSTIQGYDALNRLAQSKDAINGITQFGYTSLDQTGNVTDPRNLTTGYANNALDNVTQTQSPDTGLTQQSFDAAGNVISKTTAKGQTITYQYDALNRLIKETKPEQTINLTYDTGTKQKGRLTGMSDLSGSTVWKYDLWGRVTQKIQTIGTNSKTTTYQYDAKGQLIGIVYPSARNVYYTWLNGQINTVKTGTTTLLSNIVYQPFGPVKSWNFNNGESVTRTFDLDGRMISNNLGSIGYDPAGRITSAYGRIYGYDAIDRLKSYNDGVTLHTYNWDVTGNRTSQSVGSTTNSYAIDTNSNKIQSISAGAITKTYTHDSNGNVISDGTYAFSFDSVNRLTQAKLGATIKGTYTYNGLGQRVKKVATSTVLFFYDEDGRLIGEFSASGPIQETIYLGDIPVITVNNGAIYYIHTDHLNTPRRITDQNKKTRWTWDNSTFGATAPNEKPNTSLAALQYNYRFPGQYSDSETGLYYNYFRDYDPKTGRYIESDPIGLAGGINTYAYVNGNPLSYIDPLGLANSGVPVKVPGTNNTVRIDKPHVPGQQTHAHIYDKNGNLITAINKDGTGSHGQCADDLPKNKKLSKYLIGKGFLLGVFGDVVFLRDLVNNVGQSVDPTNPLFYPDGVVPQKYD